MAQEEITLRSSDGDSVIFYVTPELTESRSVSYNEISDIRQAGSIVIYMGTASRTYSINAKMVARTGDEADLTYKNTHILKSWCMPKAGAPEWWDNGGSGNTLSNDGVTAAIDSSIALGSNNPVILKLYGYGKRQLRGVTVVMESLSIEYPADMTYIKCNSTEAYIPIVQTFNIGLKEVHNTEEIDPDNFSLSEYKAGTLENW